jgi:hypothetical protein
MSLTHTKMHTHKHSENRSAATADESRLGIELQRLLFDQFFFSFVSVRLLFTINSFFSSLTITKFALDHRNVACGVFNKTFPIFCVQCAVINEERLMREFFVSGSNFLAINLVMPRDYQFFDFFIVKIEFLGIFLIFFYLKSIQSRISFQYTD